jgi:hypothetical protein
MRVFGVHPEEMRARERVEGTEHEVKACDGGFFKTAILAALAGAPVA